MPTSSFYHVQNVRMHVMQAGPEDGPAMVFLHGFPEFWYGWRKQMDAFAGQGWRVIVPDQRGYNLSDKPADISSYRLDILAGDVLALLDVLGVEQAVVVGHDWGGVVAWWLGMNHGDRISRLVILNAPHPVVMRRALFTDFQQRKKSWYILYYQLPFFPERKLRAGKFKVLTAALQKTSVKGTFSDAEMSAYHEAWQQPGALTAMLNWYRAALRRRLPEPVSQEVKKPLLLIWGKKDRFLGPALAEESLKLCPQGQLLWFEQATHWVQHEQPEKVNAAIAEFLHAERPEK